MAWIVDLGLACFCIKFSYLLSEWFFCISVKAYCITFEGHLVIKYFVEVIEFGTPCTYIHTHGHAYIHTYIHKQKRGTRKVISSYSKLPAGRTISGVFFKNRHFSPIASVFLCGVFVLYCISLKLSESTVFNHVFLISF